jgi:hypothetical protein
MGWPLGDLKPGHYGAILADPPWHFIVQCSAVQCLNPGFNSK